MRENDHDASRDANTDLGRCDASIQSEATARRCQRLRRRSRSAVRARIRLGLMMALAVVLLGVLALQGSMQWLHVDAKSLLTSSAALIVAFVVTYVVALLTLIVFVRRRRKATPNAACAPMVRSA